MTFPKKSLANIVQKQVQKVTHLKLSDLLNPDDDLDLEWEEAKAEELESEHVSCTLK